METLIGLALKSMIIAGGTLVLLHLLRRRSAAERSWLAHLGLVALVALPLASLALPSLHLELPALAAAEAPLAAAEPAATPTVVTSEEPRASATAPLAPAELTPSVDWTPFAYAVPAVALLLLTLVALLRLFALRSRAQVLVDPTWLSALAHAQRRMGFKNGTALLTSNELSSPISWGLMRPVILLNDEALEAKGEAEAIIAHELAHVARLDWAKLMLARVATAAFWFNPLAWMLAREAHQLREEAADDAVLASNIADTDYAQLLVGIARHECKGLLLGAHGISPGKDSLRRRVRRVLDTTLSRGPAQRGWVAGFAAGMLVMAAPLAALTFAPKDKVPPDSLIGADLAQAAKASAVAASSAAPATVVSDTVSTAVATSVAAATALVHPHSEWAAEAREAAAEARADAQEARDDARRLKDKRVTRDAIDQVIEMKVLGVTPEYVASIRALGPQFRNLPVGDLVGLKVQGVTPEYVRALSAAGYGRATADEIGDAAIMGVSAAYIREIAAAGYRGLSLDELTELRTMGVNRAFIEKIRKSVPQPPTARQLVKLRALGVHPGTVHLSPPPLPPPPPEAVRN